MSDVVERLREHVFYGDARFLNFKRHSPLAMEAADEIERLREELENAREVITEANNSLYGSQGYFLSLDGGPPNKYHLAEGIEKLKSNAKAALKGNQ